MMLHDTDRSHTSRGYTSEVSVWLPGPGDDKEIVYLGPEVYTQHTAQCNPPCVMVLPPSALPSGSTTTISISPYPTTIDAPGSVVTVTITVTAITTTEISMGNVNVTSGQAGNAPFVASPSIDLPPAVVPYTGGDGRVTTTTVVLPPWPSIGMGPPDTWPNITGPFSSDGGQPVPTLPGGSQGDPMGVLFPGIEPVTVTCPPNTLVLEALSATLTLSDCSGVKTLDWNCLPTTTLGMSADASVTVALGCTLFTGTIPPGTTVAPVPTFNFHPIPTPPTEQQKEDDDDDEAHYLRCDMWFFNVSSKNTSITSRSSTDDV